MKKQIVLLTGIVFLFLCGMCGCSEKKDKSCPAYFSPIVQAFETSWEDRFSTMDKQSWYVKGNAWWEEGETSRWYRYEDKIFTCHMEDMDITFDLTEELANAEEWSWEVTGVFQEEGENVVIFCLHDFNTQYKEVPRTPHFLLLEVPVDAPEDYQVTSYTSDIFYWEPGCRRIGRNLYIADADNLVVIDLNTGQLRYTSEEHSLVEKYAGTVFENKSCYMFYFNGILEQDGVVVYSAEIAEENDMPPVGMVFAAFRNGSPIAYMSVDLTSDMLMDESIKIQVVDSL